MAIMTEFVGAAMSPTIIGASGIIFVFYFLFNLFHTPRAKLSGFPTFGKPLQESYREALIEGTKSVCPTL